MRAFVLLVLGVALPTAFGACSLRTLTDDEQQLVVKMHNDYRAKVSGGDGGLTKPSSRLRDLVWNDNLASSAARSPALCDGPHIDSNEIGENFSGKVHLKQTNDVKIKQHIDDWYSEIKDTTDSEIRSFTGNNGVGHFTQMVWAATRRVGCAIGKAQEADNSGFYWEYLVCQYTPAGNLPGASVYRTGGSGGGSGGSGSQPRTIEVPTETGTGGFGGTEPGFTRTVETGPDGVTTITETRVITS